MKILSIDVGIRNFALSMYDTDLKEFILFAKKDFIKIKDCVATMREFPRTTPVIEADVILVERQMRSMMKTMSTCIRAFHFEKTKMISPQCVKRYYQSSMKKHSKNKIKAVELARTLLNPKNLAQMEKFKKKDDIADCVIQTLYYINLSLIHI